jgi:hypothetical protein
MTPTSRKKRASVIGKQEGKIKTMFITRTKCAPRHKKRWRLALFPMSITRDNVLFSLGKWMNIS